LRLARAGTDARIPVLDYELIGRERAEREAQEERRLFYVAMTRARERLILSGAAKLDTWSKGNQGAPIDWIAPALVPDIAQRSESRVTDLGVSLILIGEQPAHEPRAAGAAAGAGASPAAAVLPSAAVAPPAATGAAAPSPDGVVSGGPAGPPVSTLSYSALAEYERCGYRYYVERVLGLAVQSSEPDGPAPAAVARGTLVHAVLERIDFRRPLLADASVPASLDARDRRELQKLLRAFAASDTCARLSRATQVRREQRFAFALAPGAPLITGVLDVLAREHDQRALVVDYKSDRLGAGDPEAVVRDRYAGQRLIYAVAALRGGAPAVEVVHLFLEAPERPAARTFTSAELDTLHDELQQRAGGILRGEFEVSAEPQRSLCRGCPAQGGLCSWPRELTSRAAADRLF
jgi:ATP-dependent exoDNAse (exonuclease V) beta subunit